jgi:hypothetical protein
VKEDLARQKSLFLMAWFEMMMMMRRRMVGGGCTKEAGEEKVGEVG